MAYRLDPSAKPGKELCRAIREQVSRATEVLTEQNPPTPVAVHDARKSCKKARSALRLARIALGEVYDRENASLRDAARRLSAMRDAVVIAETLDHLLEQSPELKDHEPTRRLRKLFQERADQTTSDTTDADQGDRVAQAAGLLRESAQRLGTLHIDNSCKLLPKHWGRTLRRADKATRQAQAEPTDENMHTARKRFKDYWYHTRLLRDFAPKHMKTSSKQAKTLTVQLGEHHDLAILRDAVTRQQLPSDDTAPLLEAIEARQQALAHDIFKSAHSLLEHSAPPKKIKAAC